MSDSSDMKSLQMLAARDAEDRPLSGPGPETWAAPDVVELHEGQLVWDWSRGRHDQLAGEGLMRDFLGLADAPDSTVLAFARRWGVLSLCRHGLPEGHDAAWDLLRAQRLDGEPGVWCTMPHGPFYSDPTDSYREYAIRARGLIGLSLQLRSEKRLGSPLVGRQYLEMIGLGFALRGLPDDATAAVLSVSPSNLGVLVAGRTEDWLELGGVRLRLSFASDGFSVGLRGERLPGLFGALAGRLLLAVTGRSLALCHSCGTLYQPSRRPSTGRRSYCEPCRAAGVPQRDAARDHWRRTRPGVGE